MIELFPDFVKDIGVLTLLVVGIAYSRRLTTKLHQEYIINAVTGLLFGIVIIVVVIDPIKLPSGSTFDPRGGPAILAGVFGGPIAAIIAAAMGAATRYYVVSGPVALGGAVSFILYGAFGVLCRAYIVQHSVPLGPRNLSIIAILGTVAVLPAFFVSVDAETALMIIKKSWPILLANNWASTVIVGLAIRQARKMTRLEEELEQRRREDAKLSLVARRTTNFVIITNEAGVTEWANDAFLQELGYKIGEIVGRRPGQLLQGKGSDAQTVAYMSERLAAGLGFDVEVLNYRKDGSPIWLSISCQRIDAPGEPSRFVAIESDITERKFLEATLAAERSRLQDILWGTNAGTWEWDVVTGDTIFNDRWCEIVGYTHAELEPTTIDTWTRLCHPDDQRAVNEKIEKHFKGESDHYEHEARVLHKDGTWVWVLDRGKVVQWSEDGTPIRMAGTHSEITARKNAEIELQSSRAALEDLLKQTLEAQKRVELQAEELFLLAERESELRIKAEAAERSKSEFLASMSHEIRTPMTGVMGFADMLLDDGLKPESVEKVERIKDATQSLLKIINDILDISKIDAGKFVIDRVTFEPRPLVRDIVAVFQQTCIAEKRDRIAVSCFIAEDVPEAVNADPTRIRQILVNLMANAVKFTDEGLVNLSCGYDAASDALTFKVIDTGIGIDGAVLPKLFNEFIQADASISRNYQGTGLGLSICKRLVDLMGGEIGVESDFGKGSTFWFSIPCGVARGKAVVEPQKAPTEGKFTSTRPLSILVAEDNKINCMIIRSILEGMGHKMVFVENGADALTKLDDGTFDLILMDVRMPVMSGPDATRAIRKRTDSLGNIPIIALTADVTSDHKASYFEAGMNDCVSKPINRAELAYAINTAIGEEVNVALATGA